MDLYDRKYFFETNGKHFLFPFIRAAYYVLVNKGCKCFTTSDFQKSFMHEYEEGDVVFGSIELCKKAFRKNHIDTPKYIGYPDELKPYYGRDIFVMDYSRVMFEPLPIFVKPKDEVKRFTGTVFETNEWRTITLNGHEDSMFYVTKVLDLISEWRIFVHDGNIYGCQNYEGHPLKFPNVNIVEKVKEKYESLDNSIIAYTIDVGVTSVGETVVIELNDMWGTGIYGAPDYEYTMAYIDRWLEILN